MSQNFLAIIFARELTLSQPIKEKSARHTFNQGTLSFCTKFSSQVLGLYVPKYPFPYSISVVCMTCNEMEQEEKCLFRCYSVSFFILSIIELLNLSQTF